MNNAEINKLIKELYLNIDACIAEEYEKVVRDLLRENKRMVRLINKFHREKLYG